MEDVATHQAAPEIASVDINPIIASAESAIAVDALVVTTGRSISAR